MLHVDIPTQPEIRSLIETRANACVSIYVPTTPLTQHVAGSRIAFGNLTRTALEQLNAVGCDKRRRALLNDELDGLVNVPSLPDNAADATGHVTAEGQKTLLLKYARKVDAALRPVLAGRETPLILAST